jgi:immunoglobulin-binding protein 1
VPLPPSDTSPTDFDLIAALLPHSAPDGRGTSDEEELDDSEDERRTATLLLLRLAYTQAHAQLASIAEEFELLRTAPPPPSQPGTSSYAPSPEAESTLWTLDAPRGGPLLDSTGKVRDPSLVHTASRLGEKNVAIAAVHDIAFWYGRRPSCEAAGTGVPARSPPAYNVHRRVSRNRATARQYSHGRGVRCQSLVDQMVNLTHLRPQSAAKPTSSEQLAMDAEQDGTIFGNAKSEEKRRKDEEWARFTDANPRGAGNTMNRG